MAASVSLQGLCEEALCSICLEYLKDPATIECGHNFCRACLTRYWEGSEGSEDVSCPQCREQVWRNFIPNRQLANFVELTRKLRLQEEAEGRGAVCGKHQEPLKLFCKEDGAPICVVCKWSQEHQDHQVTPLEEAAQDYKEVNSLPTVLPFGAPCVSSKNSEWMESKGVEQQQPASPDRDFGTEGEEGVAPENTEDAIMHLDQDATEEALSGTKEEESDVQLARPHDADSKKGVPGIIYLGHIPPRFRPRHVRNLLSVYGEVGRIFLQPEERFIRKKKKKAGSNAKNFTEGWVEFRDKRVAKLVAASLHNTPMGVRKKSKFHYDLWNMKYLHRFKWTHLSERLAYERQVRQQRMWAEVSQAKRETNFYLQNVEKSKRFSQKSGPGEQGEKSWGFVQRRTEDEIQTSKGKKRLKQQLARAAEIEQKSQSNTSLLTKIFRVQQ